MIPFDTIWYQIDTIWYQVIIVEDWLHQYTQKFGTAYMYPFKWYPEIPTIVVYYMVAAQLF